MDREEKIARWKERIARRTAELDQLEKRFEAQYDSVRPVHNRQRMEDLEAWRFSVEISRWEMEGYIQSLEDEEGDESD